MNTLLHFSFGPVQSFISQARRTRDLYAGSWLLSHLALKAMEATVNAGGRMLLPDLQRLQHRSSQASLSHAVAPNRFLAAFPDEAKAAEAGRVAAQALRDEWLRIAEVVWEQFLRPVATRGRDTCAIWGRQVGSFWEILWVAGPAQQLDLLERRKHWRVIPESPEPGDHCTLMESWQELSGYIRSCERNQQDDFWHAVREQVHRSDPSPLDLQEDERLCAIALIKRLFPMVSKQVLGRPLGREAWPSTVTIAALPWMRKLKHASPELLRQCAAYARRVRENPGALTSGSTRLAVLRNFPAEAGDFSRLNGNFLNRNTLANAKSTPLLPGANRAELLEELRQLQQASGDGAGNFYAVLVMDGDGMGHLLREQPAGKVSACLSAFALKVPQIIEQERHSGVCVYAGGDDLLALLPLDSALEAAAAVRRAYVAAFREDGIPNATISAGLVFAHYRCTFSRTLQYAHHLLHAVAKEQAGRDAIALGVLKPGGIACEWVEKFDRFIHQESHCFAPLIDAFRESAGNGSVGLSSSLLYRLRQRLDPLLDTPAPQVASQLWTNPVVLQRLVVAECVHGRLSRDPAEAAAPPEGAETLAQALLFVCTRADAGHPQQRRPDLGALRLLKFLAMNGKEGSE